VNEDSNTNCTIFPLVSIINMDMSIVIVYSELMTVLPNQ